MKKSKLHDTVIFKSKEKKKPVKKEIESKEFEDTNIEFIPEPHIESGTQSSRIKVAIRCRPLIEHDFLSKNYSEYGKEEIISVEQDKSKVIVMDMENHYHSVYDAAFDQKSSQSDIFKFVSPQIKQIFDSKNCTIFAYGQTGSGKTYTMFGKTKPQRRIETESMSSDNDETGITPRAINYIFDFINSIDQEYAVHLSFIQIYNEKIYDCLQDAHNVKPLKVREDKITGTYIEGLSEFSVNSMDACQALMNRGEKNRITRQTKANIHSSRSHSVVQIMVETKSEDSAGMIQKAKLSFCDLAGSEKLDKDSSNEKYLKELKTINLSLTTLGKVISALAKNHMKKITKSKTHNSRPFREYVPYRESNLTRILKDSLGGNTNSCLIATVSPTVDCAEESISTLKFANRAKLVMTKVRKNNFSATNDRLVNKLQNEIKHLRDVLNIKRKGNKYDLEAQVVALKMENQKLRKEVSRPIISTMETLDKNRAKYPILKSPDSLNLENRGYEFSTDVSPKNAQSVSNSDYIFPLKRGSIDLKMPKLKESSFNISEKNSMILSDNAYKNRPGLNANLRASHLDINSSSKYSLNRFKSSVPSRDLSASSSIPVDPVQFRDSSRNMPKTNLLKFQASSDNINISKEEIKVSRGPTGDGIFQSQVRIRDKNNQARYQNAKHDQNLDRQALKKAAARLKNLDLMQKQHSDKIRKEIEHIERSRQKELQEEERRRQDILNQQKKIVSFKKKRNRYKDAKSPISMG
ncbi:unnamed protein product [Moneuplotes crassus]|uniref:Kinesin-like protein n=1 Tax=Euplotes crassus TaxID=5936 RepID=A0AAD1Y2U5_EUPCR|nr:unnamed protein product [Moneuplotes crassus]